MTLYEIKSEIEHVLTCSDMWLGSVLKTPRKDYIFDVPSEQPQIMLAPVVVPEALVRMFVETLTNAIDNAERSKMTRNKCKEIKISLNMSTGETTIWNDGLCIPIDTNNSEGIYNHSLIFGNFRTSSNYSDEKREVSGKNGVGVKCTNIFSKKFQVVGVDLSKRSKLTQEWSNNMKNTDGPVVTHGIGRSLAEGSTSTPGFTEVTYIPDFKRFKLTKYPVEIYKIFKKMAVDACMLLPTTKIFFNDQLLSYSFENYCRLYYTPDVYMDMISFVFENSKVVIIGSEVSLLPVSFVNSQITKDGGQHVQSWTKEVFSKIILHLKKKTNINFTSRDISPYFQFFIHARVDRPMFDGQNKNKLTSPKVNAVLSDAQLKKMLKWRVVSFLQEKIIKSKETQTLKKMQSKKVVKIDGYDKANNLGIDSVLIVCEGLSAKSFAVSGIQTGVLEKRGRNFFGILPLRGKFLNVKNVSKLKISQNKVVNDLIDVLGLKFGIDYSLHQHYQKLNYGTLLILTDADKDGIHIEGLLINFFQELFPSLLNRKGFIMSMKTPIVKVFQKSKPDLLFYNESTFSEYRKAHPNCKNFKYYKGLGTIPPKDVPKSFGLKVVQYKKDTKADQSIEKVFKNTFTDERKKWLNNFNPALVHFNLDKFTTQLIQVKISDFMEHEMVKYSYEDCQRSLGSCVDGLKESQRKVIYAIRKKFKSLNGTIKVAQLSGFVAEQTDYKHGEQNLCETIIKFAQDFVGTNNIPLLYADGQFGTRLTGGKDSAQARYIFTKPSPILKYIFREEDDDILEYTPEGEPTFFLPIIPIVLVNGCVGIGTGWSCYIPQHNPIEITHFLINKLKGSDDELDILPYYKDFKGQISKTQENKFVTAGNIRVDGNNVHVTELPIGMWTDTFKDQCDCLAAANIITRYKNSSTVDDINFKLYNLKDTNSIKLTTYLNTTNMVLFNNKNIITKYEKIDHILNDYFTTRLEYYKIRKTHQIEALKHKISIHENEMRFILLILQDITLLKQEDDAIVYQLEQGGFLKQDGKYLYLLKLPIRSLTLSKVNDLKAVLSHLHEELERLIKLSTKKIWIKELKELINEY